MRGTENSVAPPATAKSWSGTRPAPATSASPVAVVAAQPDAQPFDVAPAVVEEMQPDLPAVAGEPADDDLASIHPHRPLLIGQLAPNLLRKRAWVGRLRQRVGGGSDRDVDAELRHGSRDDLVEEVAARQQVQHLAGDG